MEGKLEEDPVSRLLPSFTKFTIVDDDLSSGGEGNNLTGSTTTRRKLRKKFKNSGSLIIHEASLHLFVKGAQVSKHVCLSIPFIEEATQKGSRKEHCL